MSLHWEQWKQWREEKKGIIFYPNLDVLPLKFLDSDKHMSKLLDFSNSLVGGKNQKG